VVNPHAEGHCQSDMFFCALRVVCGLAATYREAPGTTPNKNDDSCKAHFGGLFLWAKKSPHGFMQARQLHLDFVPVYVFLSGSRKILSRIHFVNNGFKSQGHAFAWLFYYQVPQESSSTRFVVKSSLTGLTLFKHTASRSFIGGGNYG
jgi:hypothetical protein